MYYAHGHKCLTQKELEVKNALLMKFIGSIAVKSFSSYFDFSIANIGNI